MLTFKTKYIEYASEGRRRIVCQNLNGPCPLLALCNALILRGSLTLPARTEVTSRELQDALIGFVLDKRSSREDANGAHQLEDIIALVHQGRFVEGLDVNPGFGSATSLEFTPELAVFDLCGVQLVHGWVADAQDKDTFELLRGLSYNQVTLAVAAGLEDGIVDQLRSLSGSLHRQLTRSSIGALSAHERTSSAALHHARPSQGAWLDTAPSDSATPPTARPERGNADAAEVAAVLAGIIDDVDSRATPPTPTALAAPTTAPGGADFAPSAATDRAERATAQSAFARSSAPPPGDAAAGPSQDTAKGQYSRAELRHMVAFLQATRAQLTACGIGALAAALRDGELAVFFRNNHFNTLLKHADGALYLLATDEGYRDEDALAWERLDDERGNTTFVNARFEPYVAQPRRTEPMDSDAAAALQLAAQSSGSLDGGGSRHAETDHEMALRLSREEGAAAAAAAAAPAPEAGAAAPPPAAGRRVWQPPAAAAQPPPPAVAAPASDEEYARWLQMREDQAAAAARQAPPQANAQPESDADMAARLHREELAAAEAAAAAPPEPHQRRHGGDAAAPRGPPVVQNPAYGRSDAALRHRAGAEGGRAGGARHSSVSESLRRLGPVARRQGDGGGSSDSSSCAIM